jgi:bacteriocin-like protein
VKRTLSEVDMNPDELQEYVLSDDELNNITGGGKYIDITFKGESPNSSAKITTTIPISQLEKVKERFKGKLQNYTFSEPYEK